MTDKIQSGFFDKISSNFDTIYDDKDKSHIKRVIDNTLRASVRARLSRTLELCNPIKSRRFMDIGCGGGRLIYELAKRDASFIAGCDISKEMLYLASKRLKGIIHNSNIQFYQKDIMDIIPDTRFDISIALGVFEYFDDVSKPLKTISSFTTDKIIFSLPKKFHILTPIRKFRYHLKSCPLFFYSKKDIMNLMAKSGLVKYDILSVHRDYLIVVHLSG